MDNRGRQLPNSIFKTNPKVCLHYKNFLNLIICFIVLKKELNVSPPCTIVLLTNDTVHKVLF